MAKSQAADGERRVRRRRRSSNELDGEKIYKSGGKEMVTLEPDVAEVRRIRIERLEGGGWTTRKPSATSKMSSASYATLPSLKSTSSHRRKKEQRRDPKETKVTKRRKSTREDEPGATYVYGDPAERSRPSRVTVAETRKLGRDEEASESEEHSAAKVEPVREKPKKKIRVVYVTEESKPKHKQRGSRADRDLGRLPKIVEEPGDASRGSSSRYNLVADPSSIPPPRRASTTTHKASEIRPSLKRSNTSSYHESTKGGSYAPSVTNTNGTSRRSSWMGSFFGPAVPQHQEPEKLVECLTCLQDDIPRSKSAKLKCGHRMCQSCLKRIFRLSVTDPQHMPPRCCTSDHIPLKHVDSLFDNNFKKKWNLKFQEYSTKNRIYCPARRCGEWIKPGNMHKEDGRKYGKCSRCKTKVCCLCNGKWHGTKDCPKDEETNRLLETAKQAGWQRCYNCRTMVELKEGCNHMTCRCTAEFCMICGLKWKSCNCPWFNYDAVEADRLHHVQVEDIRAPRQHRPRRRNYHDEMNQRRQQERMDEEMARRLQGIAIHDGEDDDYQGGIGEIHGIGNNAGHFMNQDYIRVAQNILTGTFGQATAAANYVMGVAPVRGVPPPPPDARPMLADRYPLASPAPESASPPVLRRHTIAAAAYNSARSTRRSERVVPRRSKTDYRSEAAVHAPAGRKTQRSSTRAVRPSVLAGLGGSGRGSNRVSAWRTHVQPGETPPEGVMSVT